MKAKVFHRAYSRYWGNTQILQRITGM